MKKIAIIFVALAIISLLPLAVAIECEDCKKDYENCLQGCSVEKYDCMLKCEIDWYSEKCNETCVNELDDWIVLKCGKNYFFPGKHVLDSCTINEVLTLYSKGFVLSFKFDNFKINSWGELKIIEKDAKAGGGGSGGGKGSKHDCKGAAALGGKGGSGGEINKKGEDGEKGSSAHCDPRDSECKDDKTECTGFSKVKNKCVNDNGETCSAADSCSNLGGKGGTPGGNIMITANKIEIHGTLSVDGEDGIAGGNGKSCGYCSGGSLGTGGGGGGAGGGAGTITLVAGILDGKGTVTAKGGNGGIGGDGGNDNDEWEWPFRCDESGSGGGGGAGGDAGRINIEIFTRDDSIFNYDYSGGKGSEGGEGPDGAGEGGNAGPGEEGSYKREKKFCEFVKKIDPFEIISHPHGAYWCDYVDNYDSEVGGDKIGSAHWCFYCDEGKSISWMPGEAPTRGLLCFKFGEELAIQPVNYYRQCLEQKKEKDCNTLTVDGHSICQWSIEGSWKGCIPKYPYGAAPCELGDDVILIGDTTAADIIIDTLEITRDHVKINGKQCELKEYYWDYIACLKNAINDAVGNNIEFRTWKDFMFGRCEAIGDCGNSTHYIEDIVFKPKSGYDLIPMIPQLGDSFISLKFKCQALEGDWVDPFEEETPLNKCERCNENVFIGYHRNCTPYLCESLGSNCEFDRDTKKCEVIADVDIPEISSFDIFPLTEDLECSLDSELQPAGTVTVECEGCGDKCIPPYSALKLDYLTNEPTICKWMAYPKGKEPTELEEIISNWGQLLNADDNANKFKPNLPLSENHEFNIPPTMFPMSPYLDKPLNVTAILVCKDKSNHTQYPYKFNFCLSNNDCMPPQINASILNESYLQPGTQTMTVKVNEPVSSCKWGLTTSTGWENLPNEILGSQFALQVSGWREADINFEMKPAATSFYIMCKDLNDNPGSLYLVFKPSTEGLNVVIEEPLNGSINVSCDSPAAITLRAVTSGDIGLGDGKANCRYSGDGGITWNLFGVNTAISTTTLLLGDGTYTYYVKCKDAYGQGLIATNSTTFTIIIDNQAPIITRIYEQDDNLVIHTDEEATCSFNKDDDNCDFTADAWLYATEFSTTGKYIHEHPWDKRGKYDGWYVRCYDKCSNGIDPTQFPDCTKIWPQELRIK